MFDSVKNSKILNHEHLIKKTVETLLNEIFSTDQNNNECRVVEFSKEFNV